MKAILIILLLSPFTVFSQTTGIKFEKALSWEQIKAKAKAENKFIFVDCFATWCAPCRYMEKNIYTDKKVGNYFNEHFISIALQMDSTAHDDAGVKKWYHDAIRIKEQYNISSFPSYLFFSPDAEIVHKDVGAMEAEDFLVLGRNAISPANQFYSILRAYQSGVRDYASMPALAYAAKRINENEVAGRISQDYLNNYLYKLAPDKLLTDSNIEFIRIFTKVSQDTGFHLFFTEQHRIDSVMHTRDYAQSFVDYIIAKEDIDPKLWHGSDISQPVTDQPDWGKMYTAIQNKYGTSYAERNILNGQLRWYMYKKDWKTYSKKVIQKVTKYGPYGIIQDTSWQLNAVAWELFQHSTDKRELHIAIGWSQAAMKLVKKPDANYFDTYANLLYKLKRNAEAISWEEKALQLAPGQDDIVANLAKMKKHQPTW